MGRSTQPNYSAWLIGNLIVGADTNNDTRVDSIVVINLPTGLNAFGSLQSGDQIVITGLAVEPAADLTSYSNVNGSYAPYAGKTGEILYVSFWDTGGGLRLTYPNNLLVRSGVLAYPIADMVSPAASPPGIVSNTGFPVTVGGAFGVAFSVYSNLAGIAIDDDGSLYFQQVDLIQFTGANIVKMTPFGTNQDRSLAVSGIFTFTSLNPQNGIYGYASGPASQVNKATNYSGTSLTFGNIAALSGGPGNVLYAAVARSFVASDDPAVQNSEGLFVNPDALGPTPSMVISFADTTGAFDACTAITTTQGFVGSLPVGDNIADAATPGETLAPGVNNFRVFAEGSGPGINAPGSGVLLSGTPKMDFQIDFSIYSGITVDEEGKVYVISGGTPAGIGRNPSPNLSEILVFPDQTPADRVADYVDLRGDTPPNPGQSGGNQGDGVSDRFDHIFFQAPLDQVSATPSGLAGLARGFLLYLNRTRNNAVAFPNLPNGATQGDDATSGALDFNVFDPSHQVAGGDLYYFTTSGQVFIDFDFGCPGGPANCSTVITDTLYLNSNGSVSFGSGDPSPSPAISAWLTGMSKLAPAWADLNPASRSAFANTFPVQALGFAGMNNFKVRWINVPEKGFEGCGSRNNFSVSMLDDGTGEDEAHPGLPEGPTDLRWTLDPQTGQLVGAPPRPDGSDQFCYDYSRMDLLGTPTRPVLAGYSLGGLSASPPGLAESNLSVTGRAADMNPFTPGLIGNGTQPTIYEYFDAGVDASFTISGSITTTVTAMPDFDLRFEGNDARMSSPADQVDANRSRLCFFGIDCSANFSYTSKTDADIVLSASPNPAAIGATVTITATLTAASGPSIPSGSVTFMEGSTVLGTGTLYQHGSASIATFQSGAFTPGTHTIIAKYSGDSNFNPGTSSPYDLEVTGNKVFLPLTVHD